MGRKPPLYDRAYLDSGSLQPEPVSMRKVNSRRITSVDDVRQQDKRDGKQCLNGSVGNSILPGPCVASVPESLQLDFQEGDRSKR